MLAQFGLAHVVGGVVLKVLFAPPYAVTVIQPIWAQLVLIELLYCRCEA